MILGEVVHAMPAQMVMVEWGNATGAPPLANENFNTQWFDTWRLHDEDVIQPKTGATINTGDTTQIAPDGRRPSGVYYLDIFCQHHNPSQLPLKGRIEQIPAPGLLIPLAAYSPWLFFMVSGVLNPDLHPTNLFNRRFRLTARMVRVGFTYPASNADAWLFSAVLRSL